MVDIAVTRVEQFHPFPFVSLKRNIESYPNLESIVWAQEEHLNAGGWTFVQPRLQTLLKETKYAGMEVTYAGRGPSARYAPEIWMMLTPVLQPVANTSINTRKRSY